MKNIKLITIIIAALAMAGIAYLVMNHYEKSDNVKIQVYSKDGKGSGSDSDEWLAQKNYQKNWLNNK